MITIPLFYYSPSILKQIDFLIDLGYQSFDNLSDADKDILTSECIDVLGEDAYSCIIEENFMSTVSQFKKFLLSRNKEDSHNLADVMRENAVNYFGESLNQLFDERLLNNHVERQLEHGMHQYIDRRNGDKEWRKSA